MRIVICEDNTEHAAIFQGWVKEWSDLNNIKTEIRKYDNAEQFLQSWSAPFNFDVIFIDIDLGGMDGITLAELIREKSVDSAIVFITGNRELMSKGYDFDALNYLVKAVKKDEFFSVLRKAHTSYVRREKESITINYEGIQLRIYFIDIMYIERIDHNLIFHTIDQIYSIRGSLKDMEMLLDSTAYVRCHRSFIVNLRYVSAISNTNLKMDNKDVIPISPKMQATVKMAHSKYNH